MDDDYFNSISGGDPIGTPQLKQSQSQDERGLGPTTTGTGTGERERRGPASRTRDLQAGLDESSVVWGCVGVGTGMAAGEWVWFGMLWMWMIILKPGAARGTLGRCFGIFLSTHTLGRANSSCSSTLTYLKMSKKL